MEGKTEKNMVNIRFRKNNVRFGLRIFTKSMAFIIIAAISGGVTSIYITQKKFDQYFNYSRNQNFYDSGYKDLSGDAPQNLANGVARMTEPAVVGIKCSGAGINDLTYGSGVIFNSSGYIVTNYHLVQNASKIMVKLMGGKVFTGKIKGKDEKIDIAVIKIDGMNLPVVKLGDSSKVNIGDTAIAVGNSYDEEFGGNITMGIISAVNRKVKNVNGTVAYHMFQTDADINDINTGGILCNQNGEVIGINNVSSPISSENQKNGYAVSIDEVKTSIDDIMDQGSTNKVSDKGIELMGIVGNTATGVNAKKGRGIYVKEVKSGEAAANSGIRPTDIITAVDKTDVKTYDDLVSILKNHKDGDSINCTIMRNYKKYSISVTLTQSN